MSSRGSNIDRVLKFYREQSPDVVRVVHVLASEIVAERGIGLASKPPAKRGRKPKAAKGVAAAAATVVESGGQ